MMTIRTVRSVFAAPAAPPQAPPKQPDTKPDTQPAPSKPAPAPPKPQPVSSDSFAASAAPLFPIDRTLQFLFQRGRVATGQHEDGPEDRPA